MAILRKKKLKEEITGELVMIVGIFAKRPENPLLSQPDLKVV